MSAEAFVDRSLFEPKKRVSRVEFGVFSPGEIERLSEAEVVSEVLYSEDQTPREHGPLDLRMGLSMKGPNLRCLTCGGSHYDCHGHFGNLRLVLPCFHIGYFKGVLEILKCVCKQCSHLLLPPDTLDLYRMQRNPRALAKLSGRQISQMRGEMAKQCGSHSVCDNCGFINGKIQRYKRSIRIIHDRRAQSKSVTKDTLLSEMVEQFDNLLAFETQRTHGLVYGGAPATSAAAHSAAPSGSASGAASAGGGASMAGMKAMALNIQRSALIDELMPWEVYSIFENIPEIDHSVLLMRNDTAPVNLLVSQIPVPPSCVRPSSVNQTGTAEDDITAILREMITYNRLLKKQLSDGAPFATVIETFFHMQLKLCQYINSDINAQTLIGGGGGPMSQDKALKKASEKVKTFSQRLKGKFGRFRWNLSGKRVNFSSRTVISPDPNLDINQVGIPKEIAKNMSLEMPVTSFNIEMCKRLVINGPTRYPGAIAVERNVKIRDSRESSDSHHHNGVNAAQSGVGGRVTSSSLLSSSSEGRTTSNMSSTAEGGSSLAHPPSSSLSLSSSKPSSTKTITKYRIIREKKNLNFIKKREDRFNLACKLKIGDIIYRQLIDGDRVLFNRQPSLHRVSIMGHRAKVLNGRTFRFNPCCCNPYNADFDGDEMNVHLPQTLTSQAEVQSLMSITQNICAPKSSEPLATPLQDMITGLYKLTLKNVFLKYNEFIQCLSHCLINMKSLGLDCIFEEWKIPNPAIIKPVRLFTGKQLLSAIISNGHSRLQLLHSLNLSCAARNFDDHRIKETNGYYTSPIMDPCDGYVVIHNSEHLCGNIDKNVVGSNRKGLFLRVIRDFGLEKCQYLMYKLSRLSVYYLQNICGFSIGLDDVWAPKPLMDTRDDILKQGYQKAEKILEEYRTGSLVCHPGCDAGDTLEAEMNRILSQIREDTGKECVRQLKATNAPLIMAVCGSKGSKINISQMVTCVGQQAVQGSRVQCHFSGGQRSLPHFKKPEKSSEILRSPESRGFVANSFFSGLNACEFFFHTMGGREGLVDTAVKTADTGYMQRRLMKNVENVSLAYDYTARFNDATKKVAQFYYGNDALNAMLIEDARRVLNFDSLFVNLKHRNLHQKNNNKIKKNDKMKKDDNDDHYDRVLQPTEICDKAEPILQRVCSESFDYLLRINANSRRNIVTLKENVLDWLQQRLVRNGLEIIDECGLDYFLSKSNVMNCITLKELDELIHQSCNEYLKIVTEPGEAIGALAATSMGEPATQMTLKTFHFAGVASMNITQGVPRIKELIDANPKLKTPIITVYLDEEYFEEQNHSDDEGTSMMTLDEFARGIKSRIDITTVGEVCESIKTVLRPDGKNYVELVIDNDLVLSQLKLNHLRSVFNDDHNTTDNDDNDDHSHSHSKNECANREIARMIKLNLSSVIPSNIPVKGCLQRNKDIRVQCIGQDRIRLYPPKTFRRPYSRAHSSSSFKNGKQLRHQPSGMDLMFSFVLHHLSENVKNVVIAGMSSIIRAVIKEGSNDNKNDNGTKQSFEILAEGTGLGEIMSQIDGVDCTRTVSNNVLEISSVLGIEAAYQVIINELRNTYQSHGLSVDIRHLMLAADCMTHSGKVLGFTRHGMGKVNSSILTAASYEETCKQLFNAAMEGDSNPIEGVSDSIILGKPVPIGTGVFELFRDQSVSSELTVNRQRRKKQLSYQMEIVKEKEEETGPSSSGVIKVKKDEDGIKGYSDLLLPSEPGIKSVGYSLRREPPLLGYCDESGVYSSLFKERIK